MKRGENKLDSLETSRLKEQRGGEIPVFCLFACLFGLL